MPKLKSHSGAKKRFKKTGSGKYRRGQAQRRHILTSKASKVKRKLRMPSMVAKSDEAMLQRLLPYG